MKSRNPFLQALILIVIASVVAVVTNAFASRTRRLVLPGYYPNALRVPQRVAPPPRLETAALTTTAAKATTTVAPLTTTTTAATTTVAQSPGPGQPAIAIPTATIERPAGAATTTAPPATATAPVIPAAPRVDLAKFRPHPDKPSVDISGEEAAALHAAGALFLDARRTSVYEAGHIAGSRSFSVWESDIDDKVNGLFGERGDPEEQDKPIVIYCSGGACEDSHMLAQKLYGIQFNNIYVYKDGFPDWEKRNGPVRKGDQP